MRILMVASEAVPFVKTGGLADVMGALPRALARLGHEVDVVIPRYRGFAGERVDMLPVALGAQVAETDVYAISGRGVRTLFVDHPGYFDRDYLYGAAGHDYPDNPERFAFLCQAAVNWAARSRERYDIVHAHDWQAGLMPVLLARAESDGSGLAPGTAATAASRPPARPRTPVVFTIHNLAYQGVFDASWLPRLGLGWDLMRVDAMEYWNRISYLKAGIVFSRVITTVSPTYAREIQTPELGFGFDGILRARAADLVGILNGIDYDQWDPARDANLPEPYEASNLEGKSAAKRKLLEAFHLPVTEEAIARPLVGMISRLVDQKGFDLLAAIADELPRLGATFVLLGSGERRYEDLWLGLAARYPDRIGARIGFDEGLAHLIEGGADLFLMPSRFEPCGLNQMYSLRYGTVPLVRNTGGLSDTVRNFDTATGTGTGFTFDEYSPQALVGTLRWALGVYADRQTWRRIQDAGMRLDYSWDASARRYVQAYERAAAPTVRRGGPPATVRRGGPSGPPWRESMASDKVKTFTDSNFDDETKNGVVLVDFWAEWCGPCRRLAPTVDALASDFDGRATVAKLNVDENPNVPGKYAIRGIPTLLLFKDGELAETIVGLVPKDDIARMIERHLG